MNKRTKKRIINIFIVGCLLVMLYSVGNIIAWYIENRNNEIIKNEINELVDIPKEDILSEDKKNEYNIDFVSLKEKNSDTVGYIKVNNTNIDYIVVKGKDNSYYLKHNFNKEYNRSGWIFMDYHNKLDGNDKNIVIYGHNTLDGTMFGTLRNIIKKEWYENKDNHIINLYLEDKILSYQVFSTYRIPVEDYYINTIFKDNNEFNKFVQTLKKRSVYDYGVSIDGDDSILTLSTCTGNGKSRMVLHAKLLKNE